MKLNSTLLDRIKAWGLPYHGLWKAGAITLPNGATKTCPPPANGGVTLVKIPDQPAVSRTESEQTGDESAGREWRNYGLLSGGSFGSLNPIYGSLGTATVLLIDDAKKAWTMHMTWASSHTYMTVKLRRFGCLKKPWEEEDWLPAFTVSVHPYFNLALPGRTLLTVCQNSTGREFVLGSVILGSVDDYCNGLLKINVSGTVDPGAAHCGLVFSGTLLGGQNFDAGVHAITVSTTGDFTITHETEFLLYDGDLGVFTGATTTRTTIVTNGIVVRDDPVPETPEPPFSWVQGETTHSSPSTRTTVSSETRDGTFPVWAAYHGDVLHLLTVQIQFTEYQTTESWTYIGHTGLPERIYRYNRSLTAKSICEITYRYGGVIKAHRRAEYIVASADHEDNYIPLIDYSQTTDPAPLSVAAAAAWMWWVDSRNASPVFEVPYCFPLTIAGVPWSTPCVASVLRVGGTAPYTWTTLKVLAPSGAEVPTSINMSTLYASWQPVTDQLIVDSELICWF